MKAAVRSRLVPMISAIRFGTSGLGTFRPDLNERNEVELIFRISTASERRLSTVPVSKEVIPLTAKIARSASRPLRSLGRSWRRP